MIRSPSLIRTLLTVLVLAGIISCFARDTLAYTPESPEVRAMVQEAIAFIEAKYDKESVGYYQRLGGKCLVGMTIYSYYGTHDHKLIQDAVAKCKEVVQSGARWNEHSNYSIGLAVMFLAEVDDQLYRPEIEFFVQTLINRQMANGAWSYADHQTGDTSQTQYAVLGMWMAYHKQIDVPLDSIERACGWLMRVQAPNGSWGYQGRDPGSYQRVRQDKETHSLSAAGLGSSYICAELLGFIRPPAVEPPSNAPPSALREVGKDLKKRGDPRTKKIPGAVLQRTLSSGDHWFDTLQTLQAAEYQHYFMYALERYMSFREMPEVAKNKEPDWYNWGVEYLQKTQADDGSWRSCEAGPVIDSSFAILFLLRNTRSSINQIVELSGVVGGGGNRLPEDLRQITKNTNGGIDSSGPRPEIDVIIAELEAGYSTYLDSDDPKSLNLASDPLPRASQLTRLRRLAMHGSYQARLTAVETIGRDRNLDNIPVLIHVLSDPDHRIVKAAQHGLRYISRRVDGFGLVIAAERPTKPQYVAAQDKWNAWYRSIRPDGAPLVNIE